LGLGDIKSELTFYVMFPEALSTFSKKMMEKRVSEGFKLVTTESVQVDTLENVFVKYALDKEIDFVSIDTEGFDYKVLSGNNWKRFRPKVVCVERAVGSEGINISRLLETYGYKKVHETINNNIFSCLT